MTERYLSLKAEGRYVDPVGGRRVIRDLYDRWTAERRLFWKPVTSANNENAWKVHVEPHWADRRIGEVTQGEVQAWVGGIIEKSGRPSASCRACAVSRCTTGSSP